MAWELSKLDQLLLICGRYVGVDERVRILCCDMELSIGDYILSGGEFAGMVVVDAVSRLIAGVLGGEKSNQEDSFNENRNIIIDKGIDDGIEVGAAVVSRDTIIGKVVAEHQGKVLLRTPIGSLRQLNMPVGDPIPRVC